MTLDKGDPVRNSLLLLAALVLAIPALAAGATAAPAIGTAAETVDLSTVEGAQPYEGGWAVPLKGEKPSWLTPDLQAQLAAGEVVAAPAQAPLPSEIGIRPGAWMIAPYGCTMNFIFQKSGSYAIGTAGHCVDKVGDAVTLITVAPGGANPVLVDVGTVLARHDNGVGDDFALVPVRPELNSWVDPTIAVVAGPCGAYTGSGPETVWHYGHGIGIGTGGTPRAGVALTWRTTALGWDGAAIFGAAGDLTHLVVDTKWLPSFIAGTRMGKILQIAKGWSLASSSLCA